MFSLLSLGRVLMSALLDLGHGRIYLCPWSKSCYNNMWSQRNVNRCWRMRLQWRYHDIDLEWRGVWRTGLPYSVFRGLTAGLFMGYVMLIDPVFGRDSPWKLQWSKMMTVLSITLLTMVWTNAEQPLLMLMATLYLPITWMLLTESILEASLWSLTSTWATRKSPKAKMLTTYSYRIFKMHFPTCCRRHRLCNSNK